MTIGERIKTKREELGWTQEELAKRMGYQTRNAIYQYEKVDNMKLSLVEKFASVLGCTTSYLMGWKDNSSEVPQYNPRIQEFIDLLPMLTDDQLDSLLQTARLFTSQKKK